MRTPYKNTTRLLAAAALSSATLIGGAQAQQQAASPQAPEGWFKTCTKQEDTDICMVQNVSRASNGQVVTAVSLIQFTGKQNRAVFQVAVPPNRAIRPGVGVQIDDSQARKVDYSLCFSDRCIAEAPLNDELVAQMKKGGELKVASVNFQNQPNPISISLSGFTAAFDGDPIKASELEARQKELQQSVQERKSDFYKRALEQQNEAKKAE